MTPSARWRERAVQLVVYIRSGAFNEESNINAALTFAAEVAREERERLIQPLVNAISADLGDNTQPYIDQLVFNERERAARLVEAWDPPSQPRIAAAIRSAAPPTEPRDG